MSRFIRQLEEDSLLCLSSNSYYLNLIEGDEAMFRIDSEQRIIFFKQISVAKLLSINQSKKVKQKLVFIINKRLEWTVFLFKRQNQPQSLLTGKIGFKSDFVNQSSLGNSVQVVDIHQTSARFLIVLSNLTIHELNVTEKVKNQLSVFLFERNEKKLPKPIQIQSNVIYPQGSTEYISKSFLPSLDTNIVTHSLMLGSCPVNVSQMEVIVVFRPKTIKCNSPESFQVFDSIYTLRFDKEEKKFLSGKQCILNVPNQIIGLYLINHKSSKVLIQTNSEIYLWNVNPISKTNHLQQFTLHKFSGFLTIFDQNSQSISYIGVSQLYHQNSIPSSSQIQFVKITECESKGLKFQVFFKFGLNKIKPLLYFRNLLKQEESYIFYENYSVSQVKNVQKDLSEVALFEDHSVFIDFAKIKLIEPMTNLLLVHKSTQFSSEKLIISNTFLQNQLKQYHHNLPLQNSKAKYLCLNKQHTIRLTSPIIGTVFLKLSKSGQNKVNIQAHDDFKPFTGHETLQISQNGKSLINSQQIIFSTEANKQNKFPSLSISKIFEGSTDYIEKAVMFDKSQIHLLSLDDQVHVFEGSSEKNFKRKFIHCFPSNVKSLIKLNDVNVLAVELNHPHNQSDEYQSGNDLYSFEIYVVREDKFTLLNKVSYSKQYTSFQSISFLSHINTVPHYFNFVWGKVVLVSSEETHRFNPEKVTISVLDFPLPVQKNSQFRIIPLINLTADIKTNPDNQFLLFISQNGSNNFRMFTGSFPKKFLLKSFNEIKFNFEATVLQSSSIEGQPLYSTVQTETINSSEKKRKLMIYTTKKLYYFGLIAGKHSLSPENPSFSIFVQNIFGLNILKDLTQYKGLDKIEGPLNLCTKENSNSENTLFNSTSVQIEKVLIYNKFELWCANLDEKNKMVSPISVYTMVNNEFLEFRNNLSVEEVDESEFIKIFSLKLLIVQVKYLSDSCIIVLFEKRIVVLEIGQNNSLTVRQEIVFSKAKQNGEDPMIQNEYSSIQIIELLDKASETDVFLKDAEERLYILSLNPKTQSYEINFDRNLEEDIVCVGRVKRWQQQKISFALIDASKDEETKVQECSPEELIIKKDSQIILKDLRTKKQKTHYI